MVRELRNIGVSVRARLLDRARAERSDFQILLTRYALERLLYQPVDEVVALRSTYYVMRSLAALSAICCG